MKMKRNIKQKVLSVMLAAAMCSGTMAILPCVAESTSLTVSAATEYTVGDYVVVKKSFSSYLEIVGYNGNREGLVIPTELNGLPVKSIGKKAFSGSRIERLTIPESITNIDEEAFSSCTLLKKLTVSNGVKTIKSNTFKNCSSLTIISLPTTIKTIEMNAFNGCASLEQVNIPSSVVNLDGCAFLHCSNLKRINVDSQNKYYCSENGIVYNKNKTQFVTCPGGFSGTLKLPLSVTSIDSTGGAVSCKKLTDLVLPPKLKAIPYAAFANCKRLESVTVPCNVNKIDTSAFTGCTSLKTVVISSGTTSIESDAFGGCTSLESVTIPASVKSIAVDAFEGDSSLTIIAPTDSSAVKYAVKNNINYRRDDTPEVEKIYFEENTLTMEKGGSQKLSVWYSPGDAAKFDLYAVSSDETVIKIESGYMKAVGAGTAVVTVYTSTGKYTELTVTVEGKADSSGQFTWKKDNWSFSNSTNNFGDTYYMSSKYRNKLMDGLGRLERENVRKGLSADWSGSCYGMASVSILSCLDVIDISEFESGADSVYAVDGPPSDEIKSLINYYFALQYTDRMSQKTTKAMNSKEKYKIIDLLEKVKDGKPTLLTYYFPPEYDPYTMITYYSGHAVVAYAVEDKSGKLSDGFVYDKQILIYDNRLTYFSKSNCLYINTTDYSWELPYDNISSKKEACLGLVTNDLDDLNHHGYVGGTTQTDTQSFVGILTSSPVSSELHLSRLSSGGSQFQYNSLTDDDFFFYSPLCENTSSGTFNIGFNNTKSGYTMRLDEKQAQDISMRYENSLISVNTTNTDRISFAPDGFAYIEGSGTDYGFELVFNDGYYYKDWYKMSVEGSGVDNASVRPGSNGYVLSASNLDQVTVRFENDEYSPSRTFSTGYDEVLIYEIDEETIGIRVDTDGNGTFETELPLMPEIKNNSKLSEAEIKLGSSVKLHASGEGGIGTRHYGVYYKNKSSSKWSCAGFCEEGGEVNITPTKPGRYYVLVKIKDSFDGTVSVKSFTFKVTSGGG